ncbi:cbb3-type cytochrome c oxidase subunit 3 [bacterium CPR1]|nr:cbb3-type cytochrome c oxidase subunit 3 [bacterium CPR1]
MPQSDWIIMMKEVVLVLFFLIFSGVIAWTYHRSNRAAMEQYGRLPLEDE